jgi:hypothetical protein
LSQVQDATSFQGLQYTLGIKRLMKHHICADTQPDISEEKVERFCVTVIVGPKKSNRCTYIQQHISSSSAGPTLQQNLADPKKKLKEGSHHQTLSKGDNK